MGQKRTVWCASGDWSVSSISGTRIDGSRVSVVRWSPAFAAYYKKCGIAGRLRHGEADGKYFPLGDEGRAAYDRDMSLRGYTVPFFRKMFWDREQFEARARQKGRI